NTEQSLGADGSPRLGKNRWSADENPGNSDDRR
ncbi:MAG: hypothetical protein RL643_856, partial [Actinomycetota bacterium]